MSSSAALAIRFQPWLALCTLCSVFQSVMVILASGPLVPLLPGSLAQSPSLLTVMTDPQAHTREEGGGSEVGVGKVGGGGKSTGEER